MLTVARSPGEAVVAAAAGALGVMMFAWAALSPIKLEISKLENDSSRDVEGRMMSLDRLPIHW
jgi:hypothetical protein